MKKYFTVSSFSMRLLLGFVFLVILTTLSAGLPAFWITRQQLERQAWSQVEDAQSATSSLLDAEKERLDNQLVLFSERPTLRQLTRQQSVGELQQYSQTFQSQSGLDILLLCTPEDHPLVTQDGFSDCLTDAEQGFVLLNGRPAIVTRKEVVDEADGSNLGTAVAGIWLDEEFLQRLAAATGMDQSILSPDGLRLASNFADLGSLAPLTDDQEPQSRESQTLNGQTYYTTYIPLSSKSDQVALLSEVALPVGDLVNTQARAFSILALSTLTVALLGSLFSVWFLREVNAPLRRLTATAEKISQGDLMAPIPLVDAPSEIETLAAALRRSQVSMLSALEEASAVGERLNTLLQSIVEGVVTVDGEGTITFWSEGARNLMGWAEDVVLGRPVNEVFLPARADGDTFRDQVPADGQQKQIAVLTQSGTPIVLAVTGSQLTPPGSDQAQMALVFRDVTEEEAARRLRSYFLANISHEFRTPLSTLVASMELLLDEQQAYSVREVRELLKPSYISLLSLQTLIDNLLESSRIEAGQFTIRHRAFHIHEAVDNAFNIARPLLERRNQPFSVEEPPQLANVVGDPARLTQVMVNLIINASKYSPIGQPIELQLVQQADTLRVNVIDHGPGIPEVERANIFRSFVRLDSGDREQYGIGLGLYVVKTIVEAHGGRVGISDAPGGGSLFWFEIPLAERVNE